MLEGSLSHFILPKDLKLIEIKRSKYGNDWIVEKVRQKFEVCPKCATPSTTMAGRCKVKIREQGLRDEVLNLIIHKHRYLCKACKKNIYGACEYCLAKTANHAKV